MASFNRWDGIGHMGDNAVTGTSEGGVYYARFSLAVQQERPKNGADLPPLWMDCVCFGRTAEVVESYTRKGSPLHVTGPLKIKKPYTKRDGTLVQGVECVVSQVTLIDTRKKEENRDDDDWDE